MKWIAFAIVMLVLIAIAAIISCAVFGEELEDIDYDFDEDEFYEDEDKNG